MTRNFYASRVSDRADGIDFYNGTEHVKVHWADIASISGFKIDNFTIDTICILFVDNFENSIVVTEDTPGYTLLMERIPSALPAFDQGWYLKVSRPPFEECKTLLFNRENADVNKRDTR